MEAVPRMPMLFFDLKTSSESADFKVLKEYIQLGYHEDPEKYSLEIHNLESLRAMAVHPQHNVDGVSILKKYFCQLTFLRSRFPLTRDGGPIRINFSWKEAFSSNVASSADIRFELLCIMFNIGSLHSKLGVMDERVTSEGLKLACSHFQCAAWAFQQLKEMSFSEVQMSSSVISFMVNTCLAQAQECVLEQSLTGNRKPIINAKVAAQIVDFYSIALNALSAISPEQLKYETNCCEVFDVKTHEGWKKYLRYKIHYYKAITLLYQGMQAEEEQKMGERVTYYDAAFKKLTESIDVSKSIAKSEITRNLHDIAMMGEAFSFTMDVIEGKRKAARNDNDFVYHEKVPTLDSLPELKGRDLVKCIPFSTNDRDISGPDIFEKLIPMKAHEAASLYSEEKAKLLRHMSAKIENLDAELTNFMSSLQLDIIGACQNPERLPQDLVDKCAEMTARPDAIQELTNAMAQLSDSYHDVDAMLEEIKALVTEEEESEKEYQEIMGPRPPSIVATDLKREMNKYLEAHRKAQESNETLHQAMTFHVANLKLLSLTPSQLEKHIPPLTEIKTPETEKTVGVLEHLVSKVEEMRHQRSQFLSQLRQDLLNDEITSQLVTVKQSECLETVFESALAKHNIVINLIEKNLQAQPRILSALTAAYTACAPMRTSLSEVVHRRNSVLAALRASYDAYEDLRAKTKRGVEFYEKLGNTVSKLQTRVRGTCKVQEEERLAQLKKENKVLPRHKRKVEAVPKVPPSEDSPHPTTTGPKLKDYLAAGGGYSKPGGYASGYPSDYSYPMAPAGVRPTPVGSEMNTEVKTDSNVGPYSSYPGSNGTQPSYSPATVSAANGVSSGSYPSPNMSSHSSSNSNPGGPNPGASHDSGYPYPTQTPGGYPSGYGQEKSGVSGSHNYQTGGSGSASYSAPTYSPGNPQTYTPNPSSAYSQQYTGGNPQSYGPSQAIPEGHSSNVPSGYSQSSVPSERMSYPQRTSQPETSANPPTSQYAYTAPSYTTPPYNYSQATDSQPYTADVGKNDGSSTTYASQTSTNVYTSQTASSSNATAGYTTSYTPYQYPTSTTPVTHPTYVNTASQPTPYAGYATSTASTSYPSNNSSYATNNANSYPGNITYPSNTASPAPQYGYPGYTAQDTASSGYTSQTGPYPYPSTAPSPYSGQAAPYSSQTYGTPAQSYPYPSGQYDQTQNVQPYASPATSLPQYTNTSTVTPQSIPTSQPSEYATYGQSYGQTDSPYGVPATASQPSYPTVSQPSYTTGTQPTYGSVGSDMSYSTQAYASTGSSQTGQPVPQTLASYTASYPSYPTSQDGSFPQDPSFSPYTPDQKYPTSNYSYNSSYVNAGHASYLQTQSSSYTPHELTSSAQNYYNVPYGTQSYMQANGNSYVNTTPSSLTSPDVGTPLSPTGSHNASWQNTSSQYNSSQTEYNSSQSQYNSSQAQYNSSSQYNTLASNVDLLADLDVHITQSPLIPSSDVTAKMSTLSLSSVTTTATSTVTTSSVTATTSVTSEDTKSAEGSGASEQPAPVEKKTSEDLTSILSNTSFIAPKPPTQSTDIALDKEALTQLAQDAEKLEKVVETLTTKTLSGPTPLDAKWKELTDLQAKDSVQQSISVARCYPMKNRSPDILPYDSSRVELPSTKDDYINASYIRCPALPNPPPLIVTQAPLNSTVGDFWTMVWEQSVELVVCLLTDQELDTPVYWPVEKGQDLDLPKLRISLQSRNLRGPWTERILSLQDQDRKVTHVVVHLQLTSWPGSSFPSSPSQFLSLVNETWTLYKQQRSLSHHIVVHCSSGIGRSGLFVVILLALGDINSGRGIPDLVQLASTVSASRKNLLRDREHLKFAHQCVLYYTQDLLMRRGVLSRTSFEEKRPKTHSRLPSQDFLGSKDFSAVQYTVDYTGLEDPGSASKKGHSRKSSSSSICSSSNKAELFSSQLGTLDKLATLSTPQDPLSQIDPLWPIKKEKDPPNQ
ncbi:hypothetical protein M8J77_013320 [Diaphorina citri]|nr:hypothetical protein M8J77_013320 [Diaphorina citri]